MQDLLALAREPARLVRHEAFALRGAHGLAQVRLARLAKLALAALGRVERHDVVADLDVLDARADALDDAAAFVPEDDGERTLRVLARELFVGTYDSAYDLRQDGRERGEGDARCTSRCGTRPCREP